VADAAVDVLAGVEGVADAQLDGALGHELHEPLRPLARDRARVATRLHGDDRLDQPAIDAVTLGGRADEFRVGADDGGGARGAGGEGDGPSALRQTADPPVPGVGWHVGVVDVPGLVLEAERPGFPRRDRRNERETRHRDDPARPSGAPPEHGAPF
jgi:hypothetical protein